MVVGWAWGDCSLFSSRASRPRDITRRDVRSPVRAQTRRREAERKIPNHANENQRLFPKCYRDEWQRFPSGSPRERTLASPQRNGNPWLNEGATIFCSAKESEKQAWLRLSALVIKTTQKLSLLRVGLTPFKKNRQNYGKHLKHFQAFLSITFQALLPSIWSSN